MHTDREWKQEFDSVFTLSIGINQNGLIRVLREDVDADEIKQFIEALLKRERAKERERALTIIHKRIMESKDLSEIDILEIVQRELLSALGE